MTLRVDHCFEPCRALVGGHLEYLRDGVVLGLLESYVSYFDSSMRDIIIFALVVPILLFRSLTHKGSDRETSN